MNFKRILGFILLAAAIFGFGKKLSSGMSNYFEDGLLMVFFVMIVGLVMLLGIRQILRS